jgi:hypothetical protein
VKVHPAAKTSHTPHHQLQVPDGHYPFFPGQTIAGTDKTTKAATIGVLDPDLGKIRDRVRSRGQQVKVRGITFHNKRS